MKAFGKRARGVLAGLLSAALITSGALLAAPAAYAEEQAPVADTPAEVVTTEAPVEETPAAEELPAEEEPAEQTPAEESAEDAPAEGSAPLSPLAAALLAVPTLDVSVTGASDAGLTLSAAVTGITLRAAADVPDTGKDDQGVYLAVIEKGTKAQLEAGSTGLVADFAYKMFIQNGSVTRTIEVPAAKLDRSKQYEIVVWRAHGNLNDDRFVVQGDVVVAAEQWDAVFPRIPAEGTASVADASSAGLTVRGALSKVDGSTLPNGVHVGVVKRGTAIGATQGDLLGSTASVATIPASGEFSADVVIPKAQLNSSQQYELVVWPRRTNPSASNVVAVVPFIVTAEQWAKIFPVPVQPTPNAGSLTWGVSSDFASYINGNIAKGRVTTSGVGGGLGGYLFPQATDSNWNSQTRTGSVQYRGSVNYWGHSGAINMSFANPVITVTSPISGSITAGGQTFPLNLTSAGFSANADGSVTWSNVRVSGAISGGDGGGSGGTVLMDTLTFTVGSVSSANYGSTVTTSPSAQERTPAATPPSTTGLTVVTEPQKLAAGGEIEITASGFQPNESGILVVLYSDPTVLDKNAKADANGVVRWIGKLPAGVTGTHTITLQGSINVGKEITILASDKVEKAKKATAEAAAVEEVQAAGPAPAEGTPAWVWWTAALALLVVAGASTGLVVAQRRRNSEDLNARL